ncbi:exodeoxyribonuclease V subunit gamma [Rhodohalobacter halophilus]|uniref:exodeoxyribonuclease V subunit gamma n=1 Tax=Rhodohalobacter halophilus TaxID=1812810 RepID=UPI00083F95F7|nr:exodeoxyribonuclease V subunit gamma [Rhodohalobacter halophilus]
MVSYITGNHLPNLAGHLSETLKSHTPSDPIQSQTILIPNRDTAKWLQLHLSVKQGIAANYRFLMPAEWHWKRIREVCPELPKVLPSDPEPMKWTLFGLLSDPDVLKNFNRLYNYISAQSDDMREIATLKLSRQLASVFDQYLIYRPEMILKWDSGKKGKGDEQWQAELWQLMNRKWHRLFDKPVAYHKAKLFEMAEKEFQSRENLADSPLFIFNPGLMPASIIRFLNIYSANHPVFLFQNRVTENIHEAYDCSLLNSLADETLSVDSVYRHIQDSEQQDFREYKTDTLLSKVKNSITKNLSDKDTEHTDVDSTVQIRSCHSPLREIETLHQFLLEQFESDPSLKPDDILVVTPDLEPYEKLIDGVFGVQEEGIPAIPYRTPSSGIQESMQVKNTFLDFLNLLTSRFQFDEVFDLFQSKPILEKFDLTQSDAAKVKEWLEENYVIWGIDDHHRREWGQPEQNTHTWQRAIQRIWAGDLMGGHDNGTLGFDRYDGIQSITDRERWAVFMKFFGLLAECRVEVKSPKPGGQWCDLLSKWAVNLFSDKLMSDGAGYVLNSAIESLREQIRNSVINDKLPFRVILAELIKELENRSGRSARFTDGVTFSSMVPVRGLPFKVIAMIGLNEESFPRMQNAPDFDLMNQNPRITERDRKKEDKALFLESVMAAGKVHYCSFIGQSKVDNEHLPPSPVVSEWIDYLSRITGFKQEEWIRHEAISGFSPNAFKNGKFYSSRYHEAMKSAGAESAERVGGMKFISKKGEMGSGSDIELRDLISFYAKHSDWFLRNKFDASPRDPQDERDEFALNNLEKHLLFLQIFTWRLSGINSDSILPVVLESGILPEGWGGRKILNELSGAVDKALSVLHDLNIDPEISYKEVTIHIKGNILNGSIENFSKNGLVQINPSSARGDNLFKAWLNHLVWQVFDRENRSESRFICELKKGKPRVFVFSSLEEPEKILEKYLTKYLEFDFKPLKFFPNVIQNYLEKSPEKDQEKAISAAKVKFEGNEFSPFAERDKLSVKLLYGPNIEFSDDMVDEPYLTWMNEMHHYMKEEK